MLTGSNRANLVAILVIIFMILWFLIVLIFSKEHCSSHAGLEIFTPDLKERVNLAYREVSGTYIPGLIKSRY